MKNYNFVFDKYNRKIGLYTVKSNNKSMVWLFIILISVLCLLILSVLIYILWKYFKKPRAQRKNEINDDFNYNSIEERIN